MNNFVFFFIFLIPYLILIRTFAIYHSALPSSLVSMQDHAKRNLK